MIVTVSSHLRMRIATLHMNRIKCGYFSRAATITLSPRSLRSLFEGGAYSGSGVYSRKYGNFPSLTPPTFPLACAYVDIYSWLARLECVYTCVCMCVGARVCLRACLCVCRLVWAGVRVFNCMCVLSCVC